jgi:hypothetical protein
VLWEASKVAKERDQPCLAFGKRVPAPLREHEGEGAHVPCAPLEFDECCIREIFLNHTTRHVPPAQASPEQIVLRAEVIHPPLAFAGDPLLCLFRIGLIVGYDELDVPAKSRLRPADAMAHRRSPFALHIDTAFL